jgi:hypothetical protein
LPTKEIGNKKKMIKTTTKATKIKTFVGTIRTESPLKLQLSAVEY